MVEFALILPIFMTLVLGLITFGQSYNRKLTMTNAAAEASRFGATLAPGPLQAGCCGIDRWVEKVADAVEQNASGDLGVGVTGRTICVAYVYPNGVDDSPPTAQGHGQISHKLVRTTDNVGVPTSGWTPPENGRCFDDGRPNSERRVQVMVSRKSPLQALFFNYDLTLTARSVVRFEATKF